MQIKATSSFKDPTKDHAWFRDWVQQLEQANGRTYESLEVNTSLGKTHVWGLHTQRTKLPALVLFPGARTTVLFWDLDKGLDHLGIDCRIFMIETNGLPNLSDGQTPDIKSLDFGHWANEVLDQLGLQEVFVAGASFGGLVAMKLGITHPDKVLATFLLNPGCLQPFSMSWRNLYYNLLPIFKPTPKNVSKFLDAAVLCKPNHALSPKAEQLLIDYEVFALTRYKDKTQKPYYMKAQLAEVKVDTYLLEGDHDLLFPYQKSIANAKHYLPQLKAVQVFPNVGHGIETYGPALAFVGEKIKASIIK